MELRNGRIEITVSREAYERIEELVAQGDILGAQKLIIDDLTRRYFVEPAEDAATVDTNATLTSCEYCGMVIGHAATCPKTPPGTLVRSMTPPVEVGHGETPPDGYTGEPRYIPFDERMFEPSSQSLELGLDLDEEESWRKEATFVPATVKCSNCGKETTNLFAVPGSPVLCASCVTKKA